jgi:membrane associated rhomboid family serine protease
MMQTDPNAPPINPLPWIVWVLALPLMAIEAIVGLGSSGVVGGPQAIGWRLDAMERFAFVPGLLRQAWETGNWSSDVLLRLLSYPLVHATFSHALFSIVILIAMGKWVGEVFAPWALLVVVAGATLAGAIAYGLVPGVETALIGAYPAVYGLIGAFTFVLWMRLSSTGGRQYQAFTLIGSLLAIQLLFGALFGGGWDWVADVAGFIAGFLLSFVVSPGGWGRVMAKMRQR